MDEGVDVIDICDDGGGGGGGGGGGHVNTNEKNEVVFIGTSQDYSDEQQKMNKRKKMQKEQEACEKKVRVLPPTSSVRRSTRASAGKAASTPWWDASASLATSRRPLLSVPLSAPADASTKAATAAASSGEATATSSERPRRAIHLPTHRYDTIIRGRGSPLLRLPFSVIMNKVFSAEAIHDLWQEDEKDAAVLEGKTTSIRERCMQLLRSEDVKGIMSWQQQQAEATTTTHSSGQTGWEGTQEEEELLLHRCPVFMSWVSHYFDLQERGLLEKRAKSTWDKGGTTHMPSLPVRACVCVCACVRSWVEQSFILVFVLSDFMCHLYAHRHRMVEEDRQHARDA